MRIKAAASRSKVGCIVSTEQQWNWYFIALQKIDALVNQWNHIKGPNNIYQIYPDIDFSYDGWNSDFSD